MREHPPAAAANTVTHFRICSSGVVLCLETNSCARQQPKQKRAPILILGACVLE